MIRTHTPRRMRPYAGVRLLQQNDCLAITIRWTSCKPLDHGVRTVCTSLPGLMDNLAEYRPSGVDLGGQEGTVPSKILGGDRGAVIPQHLENVITN